MIPSNAAIAIAPSRWILLAKVRARLRRTNVSCLRVRKPALIATRASLTICRTCATFLDGSSYYGDLSVDKSFQFLEVEAGKVVDVSVRVVPISVPECLIEKSLTGRLVTELFI